MSSHLLSDAIGVAAIAPVVLISLEDCSYLDSTIVSVLVRHARLMRKRLVLLLPKDSYVRRIVDMCGLDEMLLVVTTLPKPAPSLASTSKARS
jgi:anti-anti-sigma factor